jgi:hypothetical protein
MSDEMSPRKKREKKLRRQAPGNLANVGRFMMRYVKWNRNRNVDKCGSDVDEEVEVCITIAM